MCADARVPSRMFFIATLTNDSSKAIRHVAVLVNLQEYEYDFKAPLVPNQTVRNVVGSEFEEPEDNVRIACESANVPPDCAELKRNGYKVPGPTLPPLPDTGNVHTRNADGCWAHLVVYADGSGWSVSPM